MFYNGLAMRSCNTDNLKQNIMTQKEQELTAEVNRLKEQLRIGSVSGSLFGFEIDGRLIELKAKSEKHALMQLVKNYWELIDKSGKIELLGGRK